MHNSLTDDKDQITFIVLLADAVGARTGALHFLRWKELALFPTTTAGASVVKMVHVVPSKSKATHVLSA